MSKFKIINEIGIITKEYDHMNNVPIIQIQFTIYFPNIEIIKEYVDEHLINDLIKSLNLYGIENFNQIHLQHDHNNSFERIFLFIEFPSEQMPMDYRRDEDQFELVMAESLIKNLENYALQKQQYLNVRFDTFFNPSWIHNYSDGRLDFSDVELQYYSSDFDDDYSFFCFEMNNKFSHIIEGITYHFELDEVGLFKLTCLQPQTALKIIDMYKNKKATIIYGGEEITYRKLKKIVGNSNDYFSDICQVCS